MKAGLSCLYQCPSFAEVSSIAETRDASEGPAGLGLLPNHVKRAKPASADSTYLVVTISTAQYGNLTGPTSICWWESSGVDMQNSLPASATEEGFSWGIFVYLCVPLCYSTCSAASGMQKSCQWIISSNLLLVTRQIQRENGEGLGTPVAWRSSLWRQQVSYLYLTGS